MLGLITDNMTLLSAIPTKQITYLVAHKNPVILVKVEAR
jgi:hypothetical protein